MSEEEEEIPKVIKNILYSPINILYINYRKHTNLMIS